MLSLAQSTVPLAKQHTKGAQTVALALLLSSTLWISACSDESKPNAGAARAPAEVGVMVVEAAPYAITSALSGRVAAVEAADIRPQVTGIIRQRLFQEGATVKAGQALYQLDAKVFEATLSNAKAALAKAQAATRLAKLNYERNAGLIEQQAISRQVYEESQAAVQQTAADVASAQAAVEQAQINLNYTRIVAPISGRIGLSNVTLGALVTANQAEPLTRITQLDPIHIDVTQSSTDMLRLRQELAQGKFERNAQGAPQASLVLEDGSVYPHRATLRFEGVNVDTNTGAITLRAVVANPDRLLLPGMYVRAQLNTGVVPQALMLPQRAVKRELSGKASVMVVGADNKVERRLIEVGEAVGQNWRVLSGVQAGDTIVVDGFQRFKAGDTIKPVMASVKAEPTQAATAASAAR